MKLAALSPSADAQKTNQSSSGGTAKGNMTKAARGGNMTKAAGKGKTNRAGITSGPGKV